MDGSSKIDVKTFSLFYGEWGLTKSKLHHKGFWHEKDGTKSKIWYASVDSLQGDGSVDAVVFQKEFSGIYTSS